MAEQARMTAEDARVFGGRRDLPGRDAEVSEADRLLAEAITGRWDPGPRSWWEAAEDHLAAIIGYCRAVHAADRPPDDRGPVVAGRVLELLGLTDEQITAAEDPRG